VKDLAALARASAEHGQAIADCLSAIRGVETARWNEPARPGGWTRAEIAEHLAIAYGPPLSELDGGAGFAVRLPWWKRRLVRWKALPLIRRGGFPKGAPAPREIRPVATSADPEQAARRLADQAEAFLDRIASASRERRVRLTHAYFGKLSAHDVLTLLTSHAHHHRRQISGSA
jgi:hypothetical protein